MLRRAARFALFSLTSALLVAACSPQSMTLTEYAKAVESLVATMESDFAAIDADWTGQAPTLEGARTYWDQRLEIRSRFLGGVESLEAPEGIAETHRAALDVFSRITAADEALAARVANFETITGHWEWVDTPEGEAADALLEEVFAFCRASQAEFDSTSQGEAFEDTPWVPSEMQQVVKVAFGCPPPQG